MGDLTRNFSRHEFGCHCGCGLEAISPALVDAAQEFRDRLNIVYASDDDIPRNPEGEIPMHVTSGCRCEQHNRHVGGSASSRHVKPCDAADLIVYGLSSAQLYAVAMEIPAFRVRGGLGVYPERAHLHVDLRGYPTRWGWVGKQGYIPVAQALAWPQRVA